MRLHRFFVEEHIPEEGEFEVTNETLLNQWRNVLRMDEGDKAILFAGDGSEVLCEFVSLSKRNAVLNVVSRTQGLLPGRDVTLYMALIKKDNFELVLEKATELGVTQIIPVQMDRSEKKGVNYERAQKIVREAAEQSGRATVPTLGEVITLDNMPSEGVVVFEPRGELSAKEFFAVNKTTSVSLCIGPEGGFTEQELEAFRMRNIPVVSTGSQILRAETAAVVALTLALVK